MKEALKLRIGPYLADRQIGSGGMAEVWAARHAEFGHPVAIKCLRSADERFRALLEREVQAMALLSHPNIAAVVDFGMVSDTESKASDNTLLSESPYIVMELADGPTLGDVFRNNHLDWFTLKSALLATLDALSHAHSRGIVHLDVKPENVLSRNEGDAQVFMLADFGVAEAVKDLDADSSSAGTPLYMAPEQFLKHWRDYGPATDLYALGCMAYTLASGRPPFQAKTAIALALAHTNEQCDPLEPNIPVPTGFDEWIERCLHKHPANRFPTANAAALALAALGDPSRDEQARRSREMLQLQPDTAPTIMMSSLGVTVGPTMNIDLADIEEFEIPSFNAGSDAVPLPGVLRDWRSKSSQKSDLARLSTSLVALRRVPLVGRDKERDAIWAEFYSLSLEQQARAVVLSGSIGAGKSSLAQWLCERCTELGIALVIEVKPSPDSGVSPLADAVVQLLSCQGLTGESLSARVRAKLSECFVDDSTISAFVAMLEGDPSASGPDAERRILRLVLHAIAKARRLVVWVDDVENTPETLEFIESAVVATPLKSPILFMVTSDVESQTNDIASKLQLIDSMSSRVKSIQLSPLTEPESQQLVASLLDLDEVTLHRVVDQVAGSPLYAVQLIRSWIEEGTLQPGPKGWRLVDGVQLTLPASLATLWEERVQNLFDRLLVEDAIAIEVAAVLGLQVSNSEWDQVCAITGCMGFVAVPNQLVDDGLAVHRPDGFAFSHAMLRDCIIRRTKSSGRYPAVCERAAHVLEALHSEEDAFAGRIGELLFDAQSFEAAFPKILDGVHHKSLAVRDVGAAYYLELATKCIEQAETTERDRARFQILEITATMQKRTPEGRERLNALAEICLENGWLELAAGAMVASARAAILIGELGDSKRTVERALNLYDRLGDALGKARAHLRMGDYESFDCEWENSIHHYELAKELADEHGRTWISAWSHWGIGHVLFQQLKFDESAHHLNLAYDEFLQAGHVFNAVSVFGSIGDVYRRLGNHRDALDVYREAIVIFESMGVDSTGAHLNIATAYSEMGDLPEAKKWIEKTRALLKVKPRENYTTFILALDVAAAIRMTDVPAAWAKLNELKESLAKSGMLEVDLALGMESATELAGKLDAELQSELGAITVELWRKLGHEDRATQVQSTLP